MKIRCVITTCDRPDHLGRLLNELDREEPAPDEIVVYNDGTAPISINEKKATNVQAYDLHGPHGKAQFWKVWDTILADAFEAKWDVMLALQDDVSLPEGFMSSVVGIIGCMQAHDWATINLYGDGPDPKRVARWTGRSIKDGPCDLLRSQWVDLTAFLLHRSALRDLLQTPPIPESRWDEAPTLSTGVGRVLSRRLVYSEGRSLFMVLKPWVQHVGDESKLHDHK